MTEIKGIDVSAWNGKIDWKTVANYGMGFAILRITEKGNTVDSTFENNYKGCTENNIPVGVYKYSYATSDSQIREEANAVISTLKNRKLDYPVFLDIEDKCQENLPEEKMLDMIEIFKDIVEKAGYKFGIYCGKYWYDTKLPNGAKSYDCWLAAYPAKDDGTLQERLRPSVGIGWQYSSKATIPGIPTKVDRDIFYKDYTNKTEEKEEDKMSNLQKFIDLGNYYADNGGDKPYLEKKSNAYLDDFTKNAGYNNWQKFSRDVNAWGQPGCQAQPWCATYQFWKLVNSVGITKSLQIMGGGFYNCVSITNHAKANGTWKKTPKKGALVIFRRGAHVGSVNSFDSTYIYTNEGNTSSAPGVEANGGSVRNKKYRIDDSAIDGYVWINWDEKETKPESDTWKATGTATATVNNLYVRETPNGYVMGEIMKGNRFEVDGQTSGKWTHVKVANIGIGWIWTDYVKKDAQKEPPKETITNKQDKTQRLFVGRITASELNVRTWAGKEYPQIKAYPILKRGDLVDVMNFTQTATDGVKWYYVRIAGKYFGFVSSEYMNKV